MARQASTKSASAKSARRVTDFLWNTADIPDASVVVVAGGDDFLKREALTHLRQRLLQDGDADAELSWVRLDAATTTYSALRKELSTVAMFGGQRIIVIEDADSFVTKYRTELEDYVDKPAQAGVLVLSVQAFPQTTNLAKKVGASGFVIDAAPIPERDLADWVVKWAKYRHNIVCPHAAAELLVSFVGSELGLLDQELAKLSLSANAKDGITAALIEECVGSWRVRKAFDVFDLALEGKTVEAIRQLDLLILAGEEPIGILAQISASIRRLGAATWLVIDAERLGSKISVNTAVTQAGVNPYFSKKAELQLMRLGRHRGAKLASLLLEADLNLKGASRLPPRVILERLLVQLGDAAKR
ncbi:MAG: DNA polymerase III subunit delta [Thermoguttaceae bacterium]